MKVLLVTIAMLAMTATARAEPPYKIVEAPVCTNNKGVAVQFVDRVGGSRPDLATGMAWRDSAGKPSVVRSNFGAAPAEFQQFISLHECAHHQTGDVDRPHPPRNSPEHLYNEAVSDCVAAMRLRDEENYDTARLEDLSAALRTDMEKIGYQPGYIADRLRNLTTCFGRDGTAQDLIDARLEERGLK